jgi:hypothetical protein
LSLNNNIVANNGQLGVAFEVQALKSTQLCRIKTTNFSGTGTLNVQVWTHPNGLPWARVTNPAGVNDGLWVKRGEVPVTFTGASNQVEIPVDLLVLGVLNPGTKVGICLFTNGTIGYRTGVAPYVFSDSYLTMDTQTWGVSGSTSGNTTSFSFGFFPRQFTGTVIYKEGCFVPDGTISAALVNGSGGPLPYLNIPGNAYVNYSVAYPAGASNFSATAKFFRVGDASPTPAFTATINAQKASGQTLVGQQSIAIPSTLASGYYRVDITANSMNSCGNYQDTPLPSQVIMFLPPGSEPCLVWPGDINNDGLVNFGDRRSLNSYIADANMRPTWLSGPARYRLDAATNPLTYYKWEAQAAVPWQTSNGCFTDADGNGAINNFDYLVVKANYMKQHISAKPGAPDAENFDLAQNYPNPFNPSTLLRYTTPERAMVNLTVRDALGRTVATLVSGTLDAGTYTATFDAASLSSGAYIATVSMTGLESGLSFVKTVNMVLSK